MAKDRGGSYTRRVTWSRHAAARWITEPLWRRGAECLTVTVQERRDKKLEELGGPQRLGRGLDGRRTAQRLGKMQLPAHVPTQNDTPEKWVSLWANFKTNFEIFQRK